MDTKKELVINISDFDNRWNKVAVGIARAHLKPAAPLQSREKPISDKNHTQTPVPELRED